MYSMFSFHKPRTYRSVKGCCICRAKSSSSRFTDSRKYESDSIKCFNLKIPRHGEICNACVLLVKRYKRLPEGSTRHWGHVVDARAGPGTKSLSKQKKYRDENEQSAGNNGADDAATGTSGTAGNSTKKLPQNNGKSNIGEKFSKIFKKNKKLTNKRENGKRKSTQNAWDAGNNAQASMPSTPDSIDSDYEDTRTANATNAGNIVQFQTQTRASSYRTRCNANGSGAVAQLSPKKLPTVGSQRRKCMQPRKIERAIDTVQFFDSTQWQPRKSCCDVGYECAALYGVLMVDVDSCCTPCAKKSADNEVSVTATATAKPSSSIIATMPAVVQLAPPRAPVTAPVVIANTTPVLKKHHLFYKRQSECFPQGDISSNSSTTMKTESALATATAVNNGPTTTLTNVAAEYIPRNSTAKVTSSQKSHNFLHKIKADTGKIVKHSIEKLNTTVRIKANDLQELKQISAAVKTHLPSTSSSIISAPPTQAAGTTSNGAASPPNSSTVANKFSDNSSDSGFDENLQERKSASPLQEDNEKKVLTRDSVQTMFLANGIQIHGAYKNIMLTANEVAIKMQQNRKEAALKLQQQLKQQQQQQQLLKNCASTSAATVKIVGNGAKATTTNNKMRAIYNNGSNSAIQHENGITTIVPASSLAATTQTAAMNALAPSTVTITPALMQTQTTQQQQQHAGIKHYANVNVKNASGINSNYQSTQVNALHSSSGGGSNNQKIIVVKTATKYIAKNGIIAPMKPKTVAAVNQNSVYQN